MDIRDSAMNILLSKNYHKTFIVPITLLITFIVPLFLLVYITQNYGEELEVKLKLVIVLLMLSALVSSYGMYTMSYYKIKPKILATSTIFGALLSSSIWWGMLFPPFLYKIVPIMTALTFYFPGGIIYAALVSATLNEESRTESFYMMLVYGIISELIYPNPLWILYYLGWGSLLQLVRNSLSTYKRSYLATVLLSFLFGYVGAALAKCYIIVNWGNWDPLFKSIPGSLIDGLFSALGGVIGYRIGVTIRSLPV
ncbi:MAG: hypothetical protein J7J27_02300 [Euryarchaeota archaeon]|nr:hypothetical protein [Euryarchaeota archaeon]